MRKTAVLILVSTVMTAWPAFAARYEIDPVHSNVGFKIRHLTISNVYGKFGEFKGSFDFDPKNIAASSTEATIQAASVNTDEKKRDDHLRTPDFFDSTTHPAIEFKSKKVNPTGDQTFDVEGDLTIRGITKPVTLSVEYLGAAKDPHGNERAGFTATTKVNRKDFGMTYNKLLETGGLVVGDEVQITLEIEGIKAS